MNDQQLLKKTRNIWTAILAFGLLQFGFLCAQSFNPKDYIDLSPFFILVFLALLFTIYFFKKHQQSNVYFTYLVCSSYLKLQLFLISALASFHSAEPWYFICATTVVLYLNNLPRVSQIKEFS